MFKRLWLLFTLSISLFAGVVIPETPTTRVTDKTGTLSQETITQVNNLLEAVEKKNGSQILVYMDYTLNGMPIEDFGVSAARAWKVGQKKDNNGVVFFIFKNDHKMRIEVGRGLEATISDTIAKDILDDVVAPKFKAGDFNGGVVAGVEAITKLASGEKWTPPKNNTKNIIFLAIALFIFLTVIVLFVSGGDIFLPFLIFEILSGDSSSGSSGGFSGGGGGFDGGGGSSDW